MARPVKRRAVKGKGAEQSAPSTSGGGIKKRTHRPVEPEVPELPGELGERVKKIFDSGDYGKPIAKASSRRIDAQRERTGILALDLGLGGGWTLSRVCMLYGEKSSGKSTIALQSIGRILRRYPDHYSAWIDVEGTFDRAWARKLGVDTDRLLIVEPETGEHAVDLADEMLRTREIAAVGFDSIAMIAPMKEVDESSEQDNMALQARLMGKYLRKATQAILKERGRGHNPLLININQFRMKVGLTFGDPRTLPGGKILEFATTQQVEIKNKENKGKDSDGNEVVLFNEHGVKITKNKAGGPMKEGMFKLIRLAGHEGLPEAWIDQAKTIFKYGVQAGVIHGAPSSFEVDEVRGKFRGAPAFNAWAIENPDAYDDIQAKIVAAFRKRWDLD